MHGYGDASCPLQESVELIESIVREQTYYLMCQLADISTLRESNSLDLEEILCLFRRNKVKLQRLLAYLKSRDMKSSIGKELAPDSDPDKGKRLKTAQQFLEAIDTAGSLIDVLEENLVDVAKQRRLLRQDMMSRTMSEDQYMKFHEARQINLGKRLKSPKVREYLFGDIEQQYKISPVCLEVVAYCMHETIAEIVDLAIMIRIETSATTDPLDRLKPLQNPVNPDWLAQRMTLTNDLTALSLLSSLNAAQNFGQPSDSMASYNAISPSDIREGLRRRAENLNLFHSQELYSKNKSELLCL
ncbi:transcription initiation protein SPT3 homolog isoform X2 [Watersipora subatra]